MYLQVGYSSSVAPGLITSYGAKRKDLVRVAPAPIVDALFVELAPAAAQRDELDLTRARAGIRLYSTIFNYPRRPTVRLCISA
jgi:hypothetical protein